MKVLFNCTVPFMLAHGGSQVQIEQTRAALEEVGVKVEPLRWWDSSQSGDVLHHFGRVPVALVLLAHQKGLKVVQAELLTEQGSRSGIQRFAHKIIVASLTQLLPPRMRTAFSWDSYHLADASIANTPWEAHLMGSIFGAPKERIHMVPNGVEDVFLRSVPARRGDWLVCTATITERKRVVELAEAAVGAGTPLWFIGEPYARTAPYAQRFLRLAERNPNLIRYEGPLRDRMELAQVYRKARGFVLLSSMETRSLASEEACACECPLLLSDLPWARSVYGQHASYCSPGASTAETAACLRAFYNDAPGLAPPPKPLTWREVGIQLKELYEGLARTSL